MLLTDAESTALLEGCHTDAEADETHDKGDAGQLAADESPEDTALVAEFLTCAGNKPAGVHYEAMSIVHVLKGLAGRAFAHGPITSSPDDAIHGMLHGIAMRPSMSDGLTAMPLHSP